MQKKTFLIILFFSINTFCFDFNSEKNNNKNIPLPTIFVVSTGGTIAEKKDPLTGGLVPVLSGDDLIEMVPGLENIAVIKINEFSNIDSSQMSPEIWKKLSETVDSILKKREVAGVIVTHGTDTMEDGAYFLSLTLRSTKPTVFIGAMKDSSSLCYDGPENIYNAVLQILSEEAKNFGVTVTLNQYINSARDVIKADTTNLQTFHSGNKGYLGYIAQGTVHKFHDNICKVRLNCNNELPYIPLVKTFSGDDGRLIKQLVDDDVPGLVVEGFGAGNVNCHVYEAIKYALSKNIYVVLATTVPEGFVYPIYGGQGGGRTLFDDGCIFSGDLSGRKARILLMLAIAQGNGKKEIEELFLRA